MHEKHRNHFPLVIVKTGEAPEAVRRRHRDFEHWFIAALGAAPHAVTTLRVDQGAPLPDPNRLGADTVILITGSPAMVSHRHDWAERTAGWLARTFDAGHRMLGVCFGHQLLAHALGGHVGPNPAGRCIGRTRIQVDAGDDPLLGPFSGPQTALVSHCEVVLEAPRGARVLASAAHDPHHALHFGGRCWGVQFHPEFDTGIMRAYIEARREVLIAEGLDPDRLLETVGGPTIGPALMKRFAEIAVSEKPEAMRCAS